MHHGSFRWVGLTALVIMFLTTPGLVLDGAPASAAQTATPDVTAPGSLAQRDWAACDDAPAPWECATLTVPLDYAQPDGETLDLAVTRLRATAPAQRIGVLLVNCGGPGCPAVGFLHQVGQLIFPQAVLDRFDLVGWDARGAGASGQLDCQPDYAAWYALNPPPTIPPSKRRGWRLARLSRRRAPRTAALCWHTWARRT